MPQGDLQRGYDVYLVTGPTYGIRYRELHVGITYPERTSGGSFVTGLEVGAWNSRAAFQYPDADWPGPGSGIELALDPEACCEDVNVVGSFYVYAYSDAVLRLTGHPADGQVTVTGPEGPTVVPSGDLGYAVFSPRAGYQGCNPATDDCTIVDEQTPQPPLLTVGSPDAGDFTARGPGTASLTVVSERAMEFAVSCDADILSGFCDAMRWGLDTGAGTVWGQWEDVGSFLVDRFPEGDSRLIVELRDTGGRVSSLDFEVAGLPPRVQRGVLVVDDWVSIHAWTWEETVRETFPLYFSPDEIESVVLGYGETLTLEDLLPYSLVIWSVDGRGNPWIGPESAMALMATRGVIQEYVARGGNLWIHGPASLAALSASGPEADLQYPFVIEPGTFPHDYLGLRGEVRAGEVGDEYYMTCPAWPEAPVWYPDECLTQYYLGSEYGGYGGVESLPAPLGPAPGGSLRELVVFQGTVHPSDVSESVGALEWVSEDPARGRTLWTGFFLSNLGSLSSQSLVGLVLQELYPEAVGVVDAPRYAERVPEGARLRFRTGPYGTGLIRILRDDGNGPERIHYFHGLDPNVDVEWSDPSPPLGPAEYWIEESEWSRMTTYGPIPLRGASLPLTLGLATQNPFRGSATLPYALPRGGHVRILVHDLTGRRVATLVDGGRAVGPHEATWEGRTDSGERVPAGIYYVRMEFEGEVLTRKILKLEGR